MNWIGRFYKCCLNEHLGALQIFRKVCIAKLDLGNWSSFQLAINLDQRISYLDYCPKRKDKGIEPRMLTVSSMQFGPGCCAKQRIPLRDSICRPSQLSTVTKWRMETDKICLKEGRANATPRWHKLWCRVTQRIIDLHQPMRSAMHGLHKWHPTLLIAEVPHPGKYEKYRFSSIIYKTVADIMECGAENLDSQIFRLSDFSSRVRAVFKII